MPKEGNVFVEDTLVELELCLNRVKSEETLMEARSDTDVQIVRQIWV